MEQVEIESVADPRHAAVLMEPLRWRILAEAREPVSAAEMARRIEISRQRLGYHVRALARAGFLKKAGRKRRGNFVEQRYMATARYYVLSPEVLGPLSADTAGLQDRFSGAYLVACAARTQWEVTRAREQAATRGRTLPTMTLDAEMRFESSEQRARFAQELSQAVTEVIARHASPHHTPEGVAAAGRPYRLLVACHPLLETEGKTKEQER